MPKMHFMRQHIKLNFLNMILLSEKSKLVLHDINQFYCAYI